MCRFGRDVRSCDKGELREYLLDELQVENLKVFQELRFRITGNPGRLSLRTHDIFQGRKPARAVMIRSPYGKTNC